jgi:hypothetical protein
LFGSLAGDRVKVVARDGALLPRLAGRPMNTCNRVTVPGW